MTTTVDIDQVTAFATAVRRSLSDLGPDTLDDLTDGLEADLADKLADGEALGDAAAYAAELRAAAGVAPATRPSALDNARANLADLRSRIAPVTSHPAVAAVLSFLVALRPLWWVIRAWGLFFVFAGFTSVPQNPFDPWLLIALLVLSIQWGRGRWLPWTWSRGGVVALSVIAVLALPALVSNVIGRVTYQDTMNPWDYLPGGVVSNQQPVSNIFAYGPDGKLLTEVRLYDQDGRPLSALPGEWDEQPYMDAHDAEHVLVPSEQAGTEGWNVYPLDQVEYSEISDTGTVPSWAKREQPQAPFASVQQLLGYEPPASATP
jgi:hypothetical protein